LRTKLEDLVAQRTGKSGRPQKRGVSAGLTREQIVETSLAVVDRIGVEKFSLRELGRELGVFPTAIYWHVKGGRNELLAEVASCALRDVDMPFDPGISWRNWLAELFRRYRRSLRQHPNVAPLLGAHLVSNGGVSLRLVENVLAALHAAGFRDMALADAYNAVIAAMLGFVTLELAPLPGEDAEAWASSLTDRLHSVSPLRYPLLAQQLPQLANSAFILRWTNGVERPLDSGFEAFIDSFLTGLEARAGLLS
jgi:AcrR family transcriptional regulator